MELNIITAQEGMWLTQSSIKDETLRVFSKKVYNPTSEWEEVTEEFKVQWEEEHQTEDGLIPDVGGGGNLSNEPELLCDLTTTEYVVEAVWTQGDNGQVFDDYKEIYIKMLLQPTENSVTGFRISINNNLSAWQGLYGYTAANPLNYPSSNKNEKTSAAFIRLYKTVSGIQQNIRMSYNFTTVPGFMHTSSDTVLLPSDPSTPDQFAELSFPQHFECIKIGSYTANMPPNCRFMIYGLK